MRRTVIQRVRTIQEQPRKVRTITIDRSEVYKDIDAMTYKYANVSQTPSPVANEIASDANERLDSHILGRNVEYREAKIRALIPFALADETDTQADNQLSQDNIVYNLSLPKCFKDSKLKAVAALIHRYLVWGALFDWYGAGIGSQQAGVFAAELQSLEAEIHDTLRVPEIIGQINRPFDPIIR